MRLSNLALLSVASAALQLPHRAWPRAAASCRHSAPLCQFQTGKGEPIGDKAEKRQQLKELFGDATADKLAPLTPSERAEAERKAKEAREAISRAEAEQLRQEMEQQRRLKEGQSSSWGFRVFVCSFVGYQGASLWRPQMHVDSPLHFAQ